MPAYLTRWQKGDWALLAVAVLGIALFFPSFARTSLAPRSQVTFDRTLLRRIAQEHLQRLGASAPLRGAGASWNIWPYVYAARQFGASVARDAANNPVHYWTWWVDVEGEYISINNRGGVALFSRQLVPVDSSKLSIQEARARAERELRDSFGRQVSELELERESTGPNYNFSWLASKSPNGIRQGYSITVDGRGIQFLSDYAALPPGVSTDGLDEVRAQDWGGPVSIVLCLIGSGLGFFNRHRVALAAPWRTTTCVLAFVVGAGVALSQFFFTALGPRLAVAAAFGLTMAVVWFLSSITVELLIRKAPDSTKLRTFVSLFGRLPISEACGLSVVRGTAVGLTLLGIDAIGIWFLTEHGGARLDPGLHIGFLGGVLSGIQWPTGAVLALAAEQALGLGLLIALVDSLFARFVPQRAIGLVGTALLLALSGIHFSMGSILPYYWTMLVLFVDYLLLVLAFRRFDVLTVFTAIGTFAFWWANYPLLIMQQPIGALGPWTAFSIWGLCVVAAIGVAFKSTVRGTYRRVAAAFE